MSPLDAAELRELRTLLEQRIAELREALGTLDDAARPVDLDEPIGRVSRIDAIQQQSMARANRETAKRRLQQMESALGRFDDDEYGICLSCDEEIDVRRLRARPEAFLCIACQSRGER